jgi:hypothetical protein
MKAARRFEERCGVKEKESEQKGKERMLSSIVEMGMGQGADDGYDDDDMQLQAAVSISVWLCQLSDWVYPTR